MWLEVINEVSEKGTGFKACSPHVKFKSRQSSVTVTTIKTVTLVNDLMICDIFLFLL